MERVTRLPLELLAVMLLFVVPVLSALALEGLFPLPSHALSNADRAVQSEVRIELVQGLAALLALLGCGWLVRFAPMRRLRPALLLLFVSVCAMVDVVEALHRLV